MMENPCPKLTGLESAETSWLLEAGGQRISITPDKLQMLDRMGYVEWMPLIAPRGTFRANERCRQWPMINKIPLAYLGSDMEYRPWSFLHDTASSIVPGGSSAKS